MTFQVSRDRGAMHLVLVGKLENRGTGSIVDDQLVNDLGCQPMLDLHDSGGATAPGFLTFERVLDKIGASFTRPVRTGRVAS